MRPSDSKCNRCGDAFRQGLITAPIVGLNSHSVFARLGAKGATAFPSALNWRRASMTYRPALFLSRATNCYPPQAFPHPHGLFGPRAIQFTATSYKSPCVLRMV